MPEIEEVKAWKVGGITFGSYDLAAKHVAEQKLNLVMHDAGHQKWEIIKAIYDDDDFRTELIYTLQHVGMLKTNKK